MRVAVQGVRRIAPLALFRFRQEKGGSGVEGEGPFLSSAMQLLPSVLSSLWGRMACALGRGSPFAPGPWPLALRAADHVAENS